MGLVLVGKSVSVGLALGATIFIDLARWSCVLFDYIFMF